MVEFLWLNRAAALHPFPSHVTTAIRTGEVWKGRNHDGVVDGVAAVIS